MYLYKKKASYTPEDQLQEPLEKVGGTSEQVGISPPFDTFKLMRPHEGNLNFSGCPNETWVHDRLEPIFTFTVVGLWDGISIEVRTYCASTMINPLRQNITDYGIHRADTRTQSYFLPDTEGVGTLHTMCHHFVVMKQRPDSAESSADLYIYALDVSSLQQVLTVPYQLGASLDFYCEEDTDYISLYDSVGGQHTIYKLSEPAILLNTTNLKQSTEFMLVFEGPKAKNSTKPVLIRITRDDADDVGLYPRSRFWTTVSSNWVLSTLCLLAAISLVVLCYLIFCTKTCGRSNKARSPDQ